MTTRRLVSLVLVLAVSAIFSSCASTPKQTASIPTEITSNPSGVTITLDGENIGRTPISINLSKKPKLNKTFTTSGATFAETLQQAGRKIEASTYIFVATMEGFKEERKSFLVNQIPSVIHFDLKPL